MFGDLMGKLQDAKRNIEVTKAKLDNITVVGEAGSGTVKVEANGNRVIKSITFADALMEEDKEQLEDLLILAVNKALENANNVNEAEMQAASTDLLSGLPGMG